MAAVNGIMVAVSGNRSEREKKPRFLVLALGF